MELCEFMSTFRAKFSLSLSLSLFTKVFNNKIWHTMNTNTTHMQTIESTIQHAPISIITIIVSHFTACKRCMANNFIEIFNLIQSIKHAITSAFTACTINIQDRLKLKLVHDVHSERASNKMQAMPQIGIIQGKRKQQ